MEANVEILRKLLRTHIHLFQHLLILHALGNQALIRTLEVGHQSLNALCEQQGVLDIQPIQEHVRELFELGGQTLQIFRCDAIHRNFCAYIGLKLLLPCLDPIHGQRRERDVFLVLNGDPVTGFIVDGTEMRGIAS